MKHRRHIAIFTLPSKAHIYPVLGICREFMKRDYRVTFATSGKGADLVRQAGIEPVIFSAASSWAMVNSGSWPVQDAKWWKFIADGYQEATRIAGLVVTQLQRFYRDNPPDAIIYDEAAYAGRILAKHTDSVAIQFYLAFAREKYFSWEDGIGINPKPMMEFAKALDSFLFAHGINGMNQLWHNSGLNISPMPRALQYDEEQFDSCRFCFVGPCLRSYTKSWNSGGGERKSILVSDMAGMIDVEYFHSIATALRTSGYNVILSVPEGFPVKRLLPLPRHFSINQHASHLDILQHVDLMIHAGGTGSTLEALYFGVPTLALPRWPSQEVVAYQIDKLGLGINLPRHLMTPEMIRSNVAKTLEDADMVQRVQRMQQVIQSSGGATLAVDRIEEALK